MNVCPFPSSLPRFKRTTLCNYLLINHIDISYRDTCYGCLEAANDVWNSSSSSPSAFRNYELCPNCIGVREMWSVAKTITSWLKLKRVGETEDVSNETFNCQLPTRMRFPLLYNSTEGFKYSGLQWDSSFVTVTFTSGWCHPMGSVAVWRAASFAHVILIVAMFWRGYALQRLVNKGTR